MSKKMPARPWRLAYLTNIPSPYRAVMVRAWARHNPDLAISVYYTDPDDQGRGWNAALIGDDVQETRLPILADLRKYGKLNWRLSEMVREHDAIMIGGFEQASYLVAALLSRLAGKPVILLLDGFSPARFSTESRPIRALKRFTARLAQGFFANGTVGATYLRDQMSVPANRPVFNQYLSHSDGPIEEARQAVTGLGKEDIRRRLGIEAGRPVIMTCGYLIERKRIDLVIEAMARLDPAQRPLLLVVGSGELGQALRSQAANARVPAHFAGFKLGPDLASYYLAADALVLASSDDPWGLVVNEAMAAGLAVLVSDACGVALDLVQSGVNGYVFRTGDANDLSHKLQRLLNDDLAAMGAASRSIIARWNPARSAESLGALMSLVMQENHPKMQRGTDEKIR